VHERLPEHIRSSTKIFADETTAPVLDPGRGRTKTGRLWAYARDDRPSGGVDPPIAVYVYAQNRKSEQPLAHLAGFRGVVQVRRRKGYPSRCGRTGARPGRAKNLRARRREIAISRSERCAGSTPLCL